MYVNVNKEKPSTFYQIHTAALTTDIVSKPGCTCFYSLDLIFIVRL